MTATNANGNGPASSPSNAVTPNSGATVPAAPQDVSATPGFDEVAVTWSAPASDGGSNIIGYTVTVTPTGGGSPTTDSVGASATSDTVGGLTNGTAYNVSVTATNGVGTGPAGNASNNPVTPSAEAPDITSASSAPAVVGKTFKFTVKAAGKPKPTISLTGSLPSWLTFTPGTMGGQATISGTVPADAGGTYNFGFTASAAGFAPYNQSFTLNVLQFTSPTTATFTIGQSGSFEVMTNDTPAPVTLTSPPLSSKGTPLFPSGVTFTDNGNGTATIAGTPTCPATGKCTTAKVWKINITATADGKKLRQKLDLTVQLAPAFTSPNSATMKVGKAGKVNVAATGFPGATMTASGLPSWLTFTETKPGAATITGTPPSGSQGSYTFDLQASNDVSTATQHFNLTVQ